MPTSFAKFKNRNRAVRVEIPDADGNTDPENYLEILYRPEAVDNDYTKVQAAYRREVARRQRELDAIDDPDERSVAASLFEEFQIHEGIRLLLSICSGWDMYEDEAMTVQMPLTTENFTRLGLRTIVEIQQKIQEQVTFSPNGTSGTGAPS